MTGFLIFRNVDIDLRQVNLASVVGQFVNDRRKSNGSGKTAFLQSIKYALFDQTRSKQKYGIVHQGMDNCVIELEFEVQSRKFKVYRSRSAKGTSAAKLWIDGKVAGDKITVVNDTIKHYLGMDAELFDLIYFFNQRDQFGFAQANPSERKAVLGKVFKMDMVIKCLEAAKARHKDAVEAEQRATGWVESVRMRMASCEPRAEHINAIEITEEELTTAHMMSSHLSDSMQQIQQDVIDFDHNMQAFSDDVASKAYEADVMSKNMQSISQKIADIQIESQQQSGQIQGLNSQISQLNDSISRSTCSSDADIETRLANAREKLGKVENRIAVVSHMTVSEHARLKKIKDQRGTECPTCYQPVGPSHIHSVESAMVKAAEKRVFEMDQLEQHKANFEREVAAWEAAKVGKDNAQAASNQLLTAKSHLQSLLKAESKRVKDVLEYTAQRDELAMKHSEISAKMSAYEISSTRDQLQVIKSKLDKLQEITGNQLRVNSNDVIRLSTKLAAQEAELQKRIDIEAEHEKSIVAARSAVSDSKVYSYVSDAFSKNGIQAIMLENAIGVIEEFANDVLKQMQTRFIVSLRTQKETKAGAQRETLDIIVFDNGTERPVENYSGGEQTMINLALRLALSRIISSLHGVQMQSLFLDEVLAELDEVNREEAVKVVAFLAKEYEQVFVISHTDEIKDLIDSAIVIERHDSHSEVRLTNGRAEAA